MLFGDILNENSHIGFRITGIVVGCVVLSLGMSVVINSNAGTGPNDLVAVILSDKINFIRFQWVRMICDFVFCFTGFCFRRDCRRRDCNRGFSYGTACSVLASDNENGGKAYLT